MHLEDCHGCDIGLSALLSPRTVPALKELTIYPLEPYDQLDGDLVGLVVGKVTQELLPQLEVLVLHESLLGDTSSRFLPSRLEDYPAHLLVDCKIRPSDSPSLRAADELLKLQPTVKRVRFVFPPKRNRTVTAEEEEAEQQAKLEWLNWMKCEGVEGATQVGVELILKDSEFAEPGVHSHVLASSWRAM